jgi:hypothetical protein
MGEFVLAEGAQHMPGKTLIRIYSNSPDRFLELVRRGDLDLNCGGPKEVTPGEWELEAYVTEDVALRLRDTGYRVEVDAEFEARSAARSAEVGSGDRFQAGRVAPRGVGKKE